MPKRTVTAVEPPVFILPNLESDITTLEEFVSQIELPVGIPLFKLSVEVLFCLDLTASIDATLEDGSSSPPHGHVLSVIRLLINRLAVINEIFEHGQSCCERSIHTNIMEGYTGLALKVQDRFKSIEEVVRRSRHQGPLPLRAICNSISSCIGVLSCLYHRGVNPNTGKGCGRFCGPCERSVVHCLMMVERQLELVKEAMDKSHESGFFNESNSSEEVVV